jgi:hypothetical protein
MADKTPVTQAQQTASLFDRATSDPDSIPGVSKYIRTGKRWDLTHKEVFGDLLVIHRVKEITTRYGPAYLASVDHAGEQKEVLMGGQVLVDQLKDLEPNLPVMTVIRKPGRSYVLTDATPDEVTAYKKAFL